MQVFYLTLIIFLLGLVVLLPPLLIGDDTQISNMLISECGSIWPFPPLPFISHPLFSTHTQWFRYPFILMGVICRDQVPVSLSGREEAALVKITLCSRTENKMSRQSKHLHFHNIQRSCLSVDLSRPEVVRTFSRGQVLVNVTHLLAWTPGRPKT